MLCARTTSRLTQLAITSLLLVLLLAGSAQAVTWDFNGDGRGDVLWKRTDGTVAIWLMNEGVLLDGGVPGVLPAGWQILGAGKFNADTMSDILLRSPLGEVRIWFMNGVAVDSQGVVANLGLDWTMARVGDFNGDGKDDILWWHTSGDVLIWLMDGLTITGQAVVGTVPSVWKVRRVADVDGDGNADIIWRNSATGQTALWFMNGLSVAGSALLGTVPVSWSIEGAADVNADVPNPLADLFWRKNTGELAIWELNGATVASAGSPGTVAVPDWTVAGLRDIGTNNKADILWRHLTGVVTVWFMDGLSLDAMGFPGTAPTDWTIQQELQSPEITSANATTFTIGQPGTFTVTTSGFPTAAITRTGALPSGVDFVDNGNGTGTLSGTPDPGTVGVYPLTFTADNGVDPNAEQNPFTLTVNQAPGITSANNVTVAPGVAMSAFTVQTTGDPANTITRADNPGVLPTGVSFNDNGNNTATISGTPGAGTQSASPYAWLITAANGVLPNATQNFTFNVTCPTIDVSGAIPDLVINQAMTPVTFTQTGGNPAITWSATGLPTGVGINPGTGEVSGTPTQSGPFSATITATDIGNCTGSKIVAFNVNVAPAITSADNVTVAPGIAMTPFTVQTTGTPNNTITRADNPGVLPTGVLFNDNGDNTATISGTPAAGTQTASPYAWLITAANGVLPNATQPFTFNVVCPAITVNGTTPLTLTFNVAMTPTTYTNVGGSGAIAWSVSGQPAGLGINPSTGELSGTPTETGVFNATVTATDAGGCIGTKAVTINVDPSAGNDSYPALGNVLVDSSNGPGTPFTVTTNDSFPAGTTISTFQNPSANGGTVTMTQTAGATLGRFTYNPPVGFTGADTFTYTLMSNGRTAQGTVTVTMTGKVWFVNKNAGACPGAPCDGRMTNPFVDASNFQAVNGTGVAPNPTNGDAVFFYSNATNYAGAVSLRTNQRLVGQGASGTLATLGNVTPQNGQTLPNTGGTAPVLGDTLTVVGPAGNGNFIHGTTLSGGTALTGTSFGVLTVNDNVTINSTGRAINLTTGTFQATLTGVTSSGGANNIIINGVDGAMNLGGGALSGAAGDALSITGENGILTYSGTISNTTSRTVNIQSMIGGSVTLSGSINPSAAGTGILLQNNNLGTNAYTFSGAQKRFSTGGSNAVSLVNNDSATIAFTNGGLEISTAAGIGFNATDGGTVTVQTGANPNTITSGTGIALNVTSTTIGANGLTFQSIAANGAPNGIVLSSTGTAGGLTVTGTGSAGSGGVIQNITNRGVSVITAADIALNWMTFTNATTTNGADPTNHASGCGDLTTGGNLACNAPIHLANVSKIAPDLVAVALANLTITNSAQVGINVNNVDGLSISSVTMSGIGNQTREYGIKAGNLFGAVTFNTLSISNSFGDHVRIDNDGSQATTLNVTNSSFSTTTEGNGFVFNPNGSATTVVNIASSSFTDNFSTGLILGPTEATSSGSVTIDVTGGPFTNNNAGIQILGNGTTDVTYDVHNIANISGNEAAGIQNDMSDQSQSTASLVGKIRSNTITMPASGAGNGIGLTARGAGTSTISVTSNTVTNTSQYGINLHRKEGLAPGTMNATVTSNTVTTSDTNGDLLFPIDSIRVEAGAAAADTGTLCANISGNTATGAGDQPDTAGAVDLKLRHRFGITFNVVTNVADASMTGAEAIAVLNAANPAVDTIDATTTSNFVGVTTACPTPP